MSILKLTLIISIFFTLGKYCKSQPQTEWVQRFNSSGNQDDYVVDMAVDKSGDTYITGYTIKSTFDYDFLTIKYNSAGVFQWSRTYGGSANEYDAPVGIQIDDSGYIYVAGTSKDSITNFDYLLIKYDQNGDTMYVKRYNHSLFEEASSMCLDKFGNVYISGSGMGCSTCIPGYLTVKFNPDGLFQWSRIYKGPSESSDPVRDIITDDSGNVYVTGMVVGTMGTITIKYDQLGDTVWIRESLNGGTLLGSNFNNLYLLEASHRILRYDIDGNLYWTINCEGEYWDVLIDDSNNVFMTGLSGASSITKKFNILGDTVWSRKFKSLINSGNRTLSIAKDKFSNIIVTGYTEYNTPWNRFLTLAYDNMGNLLWSAFYTNNTPFLNHEAVKVKVDTSGNIYVSGNSQGIGKGWDIALIKYARLTNITQISNLSPGEYKLFQNYPNPFNPTTKIKYEVPVISNMEILITDISGRKIFELNNSSHPAGIFSFDFDGSNFSSGIYFLSLITNEKLIATRKLILLK